MAKIDGGKRILSEDFKSADRDLISKLALVLNPFTEQIILALRKNITVTDNLNMEYKTISIKVDASGKPVSSNQLTSNLSTKIKGISCESYQNLTNSNNYPTSGITVTWVQKNGIIEIQHVTGLNSTDTHSLTLLIKGT